MTTTEESVNAWLCSIWRHAHEDNDWGRAADCLYGAVQSCIWNGDSDGYADYKTLLSVAYEHRIKAAFVTHKEAA